MNGFKISKNLTTRKNTLINLKEKRTGLLFRTRKRMFKENKQLDQKSVIKLERLTSHTELSKLEDDKSCP